MGHARALITINDEETQIKLLKKIITEGLNVRQVESLVRELGNNKKTEKKNIAKSSLPEKFKKIPAELSNKFNSKVSLKRNNKGKGSIVISFNSDDDLKRILNLIKD